MSDNSNSGLVEDPEMTNHLLGLLYPDEADPELGAASDYGDQAELNDFKGLLAQYRELPESHPPAAVSNKLLAMAAQQASSEKTDEKRGFFLWLSDVLLPAVYHPGLASAASLVLIAGLAGTLYVKGKSTATEPQVNTQAPAPHEEPALGTANLAAPADVPAASLEEGRRALSEDAPSEAIAEESIETAPIEKPNYEAMTAKDSLADDVAPKSQAKGAAAPDRSVGGLVGVKGKLGGSRGSGVETGLDSLRTKNRGAGASASSTGKSSFDKQSDRGARPAQSGRKKGPGAAPPARALKKGAKRKSLPAKPLPAAPTTVDEAPEPEAARQQTRSPAPRPASPAGTARAEDNEQEPSSEDRDDQGSDTRPEVKKEDLASRAAALHKKALAAAKKKDCATVRSLGQTIRKLSGSYYDRRFLSDKRLTACINSKGKK